MRRDAVHDAADRLAHVLGAGDDEAAAQQHDRGEDVVQPKDGIVGLHILRFEVGLQAAQQLVHGAACDAPAGCLYGVMGVLGVPRWPLVHDLPGNWRSTEKITTES